MTRPWPALVILLLSAVLAPAQAQAPDPEEPFRGFFGFDVELDTTQAEATISLVGTIRMTITDKSKDTPAGIVDGGPPAGANPHRYHITANQTFDDPGWQIQIPVDRFTLFAGQDRTIDIRFLVTPNAVEPFMPVQLNVTMTPLEGPSTWQVYNVLGINPGIPAFNAIGRSLGTLAPDQIASGDVEIFNLDLQPRSFGMELEDNPCNFKVATQGGNVVGPRERQSYTVTVQAPNDKVWYFTESCTIRLRVFPDDAPAQGRTVILSTQVNGGYFDPGWLIPPFWIGLVVLILLLIGKRRKERIEEEILGKPQKPWTIPSEKVYLEALKEKDERAWYMVRHYLMEEEYQSALLWYKYEKKATKGSRAKERLLVREERRFENWQNRWAKKISKPELNADRFEDKLQKKLDRRARKGHKKELKKWAKQCEKLESAHEKQVERAELKWQREAKKAEKKGVAKPPAPDLAEPDYPDEPDLEPTPLVEHKWQTKADRYRARMERKEERIRARFQTKRARRIKKLRRKVKRLSRKLEDDTILGEHHLLAELTADAS